MFAKLFLFSKIKKQYTMLYFYRAWPGCYEGRVSKNWVNCFSSKVKHILLGVTAAIHLQQQYICVLMASVPRQLS